MDLQNWQQTATVELEVDDGETVQPYRLIFATCSNYDIALFNRRRFKAFDYLKERFGEGWADSDEAMALLNSMLSHLTVLAALKRVETLQDDKWVETKLPEAWYDFKRFPEEAPASVVDVLTEAVIEAGNSYRLFALLPQGDEEKKVLRLTVQPSKT